MGKLLKTNGGFVIDRPGNVLFIPVKPDGSLDKLNAKRNTALINTITITNSKTKTEIPNGNSFYPGGERVTGITGTVAIEFSTIDPEIWAMCSGTVVKKNASDSMIKLYEAQKVGDSDYTIKLKENFKTGGFIQIVGADGTEYEKSEGSATEPSNYTIQSTEGTTITFNEAAKGKSVIISMEVTEKTSSYSQGREAMKNHKIIIDTEYSTLNDTQKIPVNFEISQASISGDMVDSLQKDPSATKTLTFNMYAPLPGEQPYSVKLKDLDIA